MCLHIRHVNYEAKKLYVDIALELDNIFLLSKTDAAICHATFEYAT